MSSSSTTDVSVSTSSKKGVKRKNDLGISQPIHHQENIANTSNQSALTQNPYQMPPLKKFRVASSANTTDNNHNKPKKKPLCIYAKPDNDKSMLNAANDAKTMINFSCIGYDCLIKYCQMFNLHQFEYDYHYDLGHTPRSHSVHHEPEDASIAENENAKPNAIEGHNDSARIGKREMDDMKETISDKKQQNKNKKKKSKKKGKHKREHQSKTEHHYFNSDDLDIHYEKSREAIPKSLEVSTRLTKTELVNIVREHFLSTPILAEMDEIDVMKQFLKFIQKRRDKLKKEFHFQ